MQPGLKIDMSHYTIEEVMRLGERHAGAIEEIEHRGEVVLINYKLSNLQLKALINEVDAKARLESGLGIVEWGAPERQEVFILKLGAILTDNARNEQPALAGRLD